MALRGDNFLGNYFLFGGPVFDLWSYPQDSWRALGRVGGEA